MANTRGVFRLTYIIEEKISIDSWISLSDVWVAPSPSGSPVKLPGIGSINGDTSTYKSPISYVEYQATKKKQM